MISLFLLNQIISLEITFWIQRTKSCYYLALIFTGIL